MKCNLCCQLINNLFGLTNLFQGSTITVSNEEIAETSLEQPKKRGRKKKAQND